MQKQLIPFDQMKEKIKPGTAYEDACAFLGQPTMALDAFAGFPEDERQYHLSEHRLLTVHKAFHQGRKHDYNASTQKHFPVWDRETYNDGREKDGFALYDVAYRFGDSYVGARLCGFSEEESEYIAEIMYDDYRVTQSQ